MSKNQSIKSFFTSSSQNAKKKQDTESSSPTKDLKPKEETKPTAAATRKSPAVSSSLKTNSSDLYDNEEDIVEKENKLILKSSKKNLVKNEKKDVSSPKRKAAASPAEKKSKKKVVKSDSSSSESDDSPIKNSTAKSDGKRRKLVLESSSEEESVNTVTKTVAKVEIKETKIEETKLEETESQMETDDILIEESKAEKIEIKTAEPEEPTKREIKAETKTKSPKIAKLFSKSEPKKTKSPVKTEAKSPVKLEPTKPISNFFSTKKTETNMTISTSTTSSSNTYLPNKENYHPINDACWEKDQPVPYTALAQTFFCMEQTTKRLELLSIVCNYFRSVMALTPKDLVPSMYLLTNKVAPDYDSLELGIGDTILFKALAEATGCTVAKLKVEFQNKGDIGLVAEANRCNQKLIFTPKKLTVQSAFTKLREIATISGNSSQNKKCEMIKGLLVSCDPIEARYIMRILAGKLRNGLGELSILSALAHACATTHRTLDSDELVEDAFKKLRKQDKLDEVKEELNKAAKMVKQAYYQCPNYDHVINAIITHGLENVEQYCKLKPGVPLKPMLANPTKGVQEILKRFDQIEFTCEYKYDGERAQIHILENGSIEVFSRNSENNTSKYPDIIQMLKDLLNLKGSTKTDAEPSKIKTAILDAEVVAYDLEKDLILPFQVLSTRKRKDAVSADIKIQVCIFAFDLLFLNGESLIEKPLRKRREFLYEYFPLTPTKLMFAVNMNSSNLETIQEFLDKSVKDGCEGLMVKTLDTEAHYEISKRSHNWLKLKKDYLDGCGDSLDLVVIGGYLGTGKRTGTYGGYLLACYDAENEEYQTICKIGTGFKDDDLKEQFESLGKIKIDKPRSYYRYNESLEQPDHWFEPEMVWEIKCADFSLSPVHTAAIGILDDGRGISMRFPRYLRTRDDKKAEDATNSEQVAEMYKSQQQMVNQNQANEKQKESDNEDE